MQFGSHHACGHGRVRFHEFSRGSFVCSLKNRNSKCFIARFFRPSGQDELTGLNRRLEIGEMPIDRRFVICRPSFVVVKAGYEMQHVNELFRLFGFRFLGIGQVRECGNVNHQADKLSKEILHFNRIYRIKLDCSMKNLPNPVYPVALLFLASWFDSLAPAYSPPARGGLTIYPTASLLAVFLHS